MRVIKAHHIEAAGAGGTHCVEMIERIDNKPAFRLVGNVVGGQCVRDSLIVTDQDAATLEWSNRACVTQNGINRGGGYVHAVTHLCYESRSTAMAIPIPPPMQSDATP